MFRWWMLTLSVATGFAQTPADLFNKPPADVDQALRARITEFFQDHVDGKYRQAEALVADDTKDYFYSGNKPKYLSFEIRSITYSEGYTKAKALVMCEQILPFPVFAGKPVNVPTPSTWKLEDGQWYWWVDPALVNQTPWGVFKPGPGVSPGQITLPNAEDVLRNASRQVKADKTAVSLKPGGGSDEVTIANAAPGPMTVSVLTPLTGVEVKPDHLEIKAGGKATMTFHAAGNAKPGAISLRVDQTNAVIPIQVAIQ
jgi:hypothetical protein